MSALDDFLQSCSLEITRRAALAGEDALALRDGARSFAAAVETCVELPLDKASVPVAAQLTTLDDTPLAAALGPALDEMSWVASARMTDGGTEAALAPLHEVRDLGDVIVGLMLIGAGCSYPEHSHPPQELYLPITEGGQWRYGGLAQYRELSSDTLVYNHPNDRHGAHALPDKPLVALYVLWP